MNCLRSFINLNVIKCEIHEQLRSLRRMNEQIRNYKGTDCFQTFGVCTRLFVNIRTYSLLLGYSL